MLHMEKRNLQTYLSLCTEVKSKLFKDLDIEAETWTLLEVKISKTLEDIGVGKDLLNRTLIAQETIHSKNQHIGLCQSKRLSFSKGNNQ